MLSFLILAITLSCTFTYSTASQKTSVIQGLHTKNDDNSQGFVDRNIALYQITEPLDHTECPTWDPRTNTLYFVDIHVGKLYSYNVTTEELHSVQVDGTVAPIVQTKDEINRFIIGLNRSIVEIRWDGIAPELESQRILASVAADKPTSRMNDGKADKEGRLWFGTMGYEADNGSLTPNEGTLYRFSAQNSNTSVPIPVLSPVNISNGLAWNRANTKFYYIDSPSLQIAEYDYDSAGGGLANKRVAFDLTLNNISAHPDGMTIDIDDNLWIALHGGGSVIKINPLNGELLERIPIPAVRVTSVIWGGAELDVLFVTTSRHGLSDEEIAQQPGAGSVYALTNLGTRGLPVYEAIA